MAAIDDALSGPMSSASLIIQHLRETVPTLTPSALAEHLARVQANVSAHAVDLHLLHSAVMMQAAHPALLYEMMLTEDVIKLAVEECHYQKPDCAMHYKASQPNGRIMHGDVRAIQRALAGLMAAMQHDVFSSDVVECAYHEGFAIITLCDHPSMLQAQDFVVIDATTNLIALSNVTRQRVVPLSYALQVAHAHNGRLELMIGPKDLLGVRFVLPQPTESSQTHA
jgi:hypothetical protein